MGTRHLICVVEGGDFKIAQYGQWDGYPSGQGVDVLSFLSTADLAVFREKVRSLTWATEQDVMDSYAACGVEVIDGMIAFNDALEKWEAEYPQYSRGTGAKILSLVLDSDKPLRLKDSRTFAADSLFCEYAYVIDLDANTLEVYSGFQEQPHSLGRFAGSEPDRGYYPVALVKTWSLGDLPSEEDFLAALESEENE